MLATRRAGGPVRRTAPRMSALGAAAAGAGCDSRLATRDSPVAALPLPRPRGRRRLAPVAGRLPRPRRSRGGATRGPRKRGREGSPHCLGLGVGVGGLERIRVHVLPGVSSVGGVRRDAARQAPKGLTRPHPGGWYSPRRADGFSVGAPAHSGPAGRRFPPRPQPSRSPRQPSAGRRPPCAPVPAGPRAAPRRRWPDAPGGPRGKGARSSRTRLKTAALRSRRAERVPDSELDALAPDGAKELADSPPGPRGQVGERLGRLGPAVPRGARAPPPPPHPAPSRGRW